MGGVYVLLESWMLEYRVICKVGLTSSSIVNCPSIGEMRRTAEKGKVCTSVDWEESAEGTMGDLAGRPKGASKLRMRDENELSFPSIADFCDPCNSSHSN